MTDAQILMDMFCRRRIPFELDQFGNLIVDKRIYFCFAINDPNEELQQNLIGVEVEEPDECPS